LPSITPTDLRRNGSPTSGCATRKCELAGFLLEKEYWPEWNGRFARPLQGVTDLHRPLTPEIDLASSMSRVESRVIGDDYTIPFAGRKYRIARKDVRAG
jgi:hypothetical protein